MSDHTKAVRPQGMPRAFHARRGVRPAVLPPATPPPVQDVQPPPVQVSAVSPLTTQPTIPAAKPPRVSYPTIDSQGFGADDVAESSTAWFERNLSFAVSVITNLCVLIALALVPTAGARQPTEIVLSSSPLPELEEVVEIGKPAEDLVIEDYKGLTEVGGDLTSLPEAVEIGDLATNSVSPIDAPGGKSLLDEIALSGDVLQNLGSSTGRGAAGGNGGLGPGDNANLAAFTTRLQKAGAQTGDIQISLIWNNYNDLDLHVVTPRGETIFFGHRRSRDRGNLDVDMNGGRPMTQEPVENVFWKEGTAPLGKFKVYVHHYRRQGDPDPTEFEVRVVVDGDTKVFHGETSFPERRVLVHEFTRSGLPVGPPSISQKSAADDFPLMERK